MTSQDLLVTLKKYDFSQHSKYNGRQPHAFGKLYDVFPIAARNILEGIVGDENKVKAEELMFMVYGYLRTRYDEIDFEELENLTKEPEALFYAQPLFDTKELLPSLGKTLISFIRSPSQDGLEKLRQIRLDLVNADSNPQYRQRIKQLEDRLYQEPAL